ncbi:peptidase S10 [Rhizorhabdus sp.]|uniref:S10 family peptidase n=1 Tax=Rhizorhabdus sp. TaxID=1968843 RepID=UPI001982DE11|nr:peptidase S10 [Rhizorhabdus sp.]MBD3762874.1 peptidase S10 [Rhizorhabdus sp.]
MRFTTCLAAAALALSPIAAHADEKKDDAAQAPVPPPIVSVTKHKGVFGGQSIAYTATTGETYLKDKDGKPLAAIFATSYVKDGGDKGRPVTFLYNGGPGSGSLWLHMGAFGPKRVVLPDARDDGAPPYPIVDNPESLLDVTDIVFIDPVGTGFAHAIGAKDPKDYWGVSADAKSIAEFIRLWLSEHGRWASPKYIGGESYGTTRSVALINELEGQYNDVAINGIILISTILDFAASAETQGNEMPYILNLPSMATTAWYHRKIANPPATAAEIAAQARAFAIGPYAAALLKGNALGAQERAAVRAELARLTGLSEAFVDNADLRVSPGRFYKELLRDRGLTIGRLDTRYTGIDYDKAGEEPDNDPSFYGIDAAYTSAINSYLRDDLKLRIDRQYVTIGGVGPWDWKLADQRGRDGEVYVNVAPYLGKALRENSGLKVFVGQGWYDFATPFFGAEYAMSRTGFDPARIQYHYYDAGHMMYVRPEDLRKLSADVRAFIRAR